jgi:2-polyprenyl-6-methoxyphenol hydroxylase-like FAD-dependent oxidoreductase
MEKAMARSERDLSPAGRGHAVIAGAGVAGLLAAAVLAEFFERVTIVERDAVSAGAEPRRGVPQGRHAHALLPRGLAALERLFPGFAEAAAGQGAVAANAATDVSWGLGGCRLVAAPDTLPVIVSTRPFLENEIRRRVAAIANVAFLAGTRVCDFVLDGQAVTGLMVERGAAGPAERLDADLVVDATGRASRLPAWLRRHGFTPAAEEVMDVDVGYATARYNADPGRLGGRRALLVGATPSCPRSGVVHVVESGLMEVSLTGYRGEHPRATLPEFVAHAGSLALPDIHQLIHDAEPCSDIALFHVAQTVRRQYHKIDRLPQGIVAIGDAMCAFNPVFAQGMTVAALEALTLRDALRQAEAGAGHADFIRQFYRQAARELDPAWQMARGSDLMIPHLAHYASSIDRLMSFWIRNVLAVGTREPLVARQFIRVASLVDSPPTLFAPGVVLRVLPKVH